LGRSSTSSTHNFQGFLAVSAAADSASPPAKPAETPAPHYQFKALAKGSREIVIEYEGQLYRLRLTKNDRLILNK
jgi:hemin uptake protein HemP